MPPLALGKKGPRSAKCRATRPAATPKQRGAGSCVSRIAPNEAPVDPSLRILFGGAHGSSARSTLE